MQSITQAKNTIEMSPSQGIIQQEMSHSERITQKEMEEIQNLVNFDFYFRKLQDITGGLLYLYIQEPDYINFLKNN